VPGPNYNPALVKQTAVGTATITFNSNTDATLTYSYDNKGGSMSLQRFSFASPNLMQTFHVIDHSYECNSTSPGQSQIRIHNGIEQIGNKFTVVTPKLDGTDVCTLSMTSQQAGSKLNAQGTANCFGDPETFHFAMEDLLVQSDFISYTYTISRKQDGSLMCVQRGKMAGVVQKVTTPSYDLATAFKNKMLTGFSKTQVISGDCTGTFSKTNAPAVKTTWNGLSVYAVATTEITTSSTCTTLSGVKTSITYFDMNFVELATTNSDGTYSDYSGTGPSGFVKVGDTGTMGTWNNWKDSSKKVKNDTDQVSFVIEPDSTTSVIFNRIFRKYDNNNVLKRTTQVKFRVTATGDFDWIAVIVDTSDPKSHLEFR
jgi:hypothetical protein